MSHEEAALEIYRAQMDDLRNADAIERNEHKQYRNELLERQLTIRQQAVLLAMQGILSRDETDVQYRSSLSEVAQAAVFVADAVLKAERETR